MTDTKFTPGPWAVSSRASRRVTTTHGVVICNAVLRNQGSAKGGLKHGAKSAATAEANARLIAASPALYEALEGLLAEVGRCGSDGYFDGHIHRDEVHKARAALALARGEA